jgi:hypothetical protein
MRHSLNDIVTELNLHYIKIQQPWQYFIVVKYLHKKEYIYNLTLKKYREINEGR